MVEHRPVSLVPAPVEKVGQFTPFAFLNQAAGEALVLEMFNGRDHATSHAGQESLANDAGELIGQDDGDAFALAFREEPNEPLQGLGT